ncbi:hypothetical protein PPYR_00909 [Photinus pyralis]|uniref:Methyltransferase-like protein 17, mitochondrial n=1 Tax=Photinus pyralis TaxID=7054 RepID=A0A1Y1NKX5_PHOPY|nr:methyltransferase-like protein 17, mitochondrial [Photinus pyralis]XP_031343083.1 methyltransferase-like protein 17, mitochondrial [Photinus pyralis]KAB0803939.1 hypothetical protein PPYR_00909 [Photinus pyralis]
MFKSKIKNISIKLIRQFAAVRPVVQLDSSIPSEIDHLKFKPKHHPGRVTLKPVSIPKHLLKSIENVLSDYPITSMIEESKYLDRYLQGRQRPLEAFEIKDMEKKIRQGIIDNINKQNMTEQDIQSVNDVVKKNLSQQMNNRCSIQYGIHHSLLYLLARFAPEYAVLLQIFSEICTRDPNFKPRSLFDFGSGTGTVSWAAKHVWDKDIYEFFNVDASPEMNELAQLLIQGGRPTNQSNFKGIFYRQFLPANHIAYDLIVCAYTLLDLPTRKSRLQTLLNLWNKSVKYLVLVERGTRAGFEVINEARDFILNLKDGHDTCVFSPCPHDAVCPKFLNNDRCHFQASYYSLPIGSVSQSCRENYAYIVLKKAVRSESDTNWPRLIEAPLVRSRHVVCRMCTNQGNLNEVVFTSAKHGKVTYRCAKASKWGDLLPINILPDAVG